MSNSDSWHSLSSSSSYEEEEVNDDNTKNDYKIDKDDNDDDNESIQNDFEENQSTINIFRGEIFQNADIIEDSKDSVLLLAKFKLKNSTTSIISNKKCLMQKFYDDLSKYSKEFIDDLSHKLNSLTYLHHPSIGQIIGYSLNDFNNESRILLLYDVKLSNSLDQRIKNANFFDHSDQLISIYGIALGMSYLHSKNIVHKHLTPSNIYYNKDNPKIINFFDFQISNKRQKFPEIDENLIYAPPEVLQGEEYTKAGDVYSFGFIIYQILTQKKLNINLNYFQFISSVIQGQRPNRDALITDVYWNIIMQCWSPNPSERPTFKSIVKQIENNPNFITSISAYKDKFDKYVEYVKQNLNSRIILSDFLIMLEKNTLNEQIDENFMTGGFIDESSTEEMLFKCSAECIDLGSFSEHTRIGEGGFGVIYKVVDTKNQKEFCAKISKKEIFGDCLNENSDAISISSEISIMSFLDHPSIVKFIGYSPTDFKNRPNPAIIMEYVNNGSLSDILQKESQSLAYSEWTSTKKLISIYGIASAMKYLHLNNILHLDLKSENILLDENFYPKLTDFGLSAQIDKIKKNEKKVYKGTPIFMAPEIWSSSDYTKEVDVYAFGLTVYEIMTSEKPFNNLKGIYQILIEVVENKKRPEFNYPIPDCYRKLIEDCWAQDPKDRPSFDEIVQRLRNDSKFINEASVDEDEFFIFVEAVDGFFILNQTSKKEDIKEDVKEVNNKNENDEKINE